MSAYKAQCGNNVYIGITKNFEKRIREHRCQFKTNKSPFGNIAKAFSEIHFELIDHPSDLNSGSVETAAICAFRALGFNVLNKQRGSDGISRARKFLHPEADKVRHLKRVEKFKGENARRVGLLGIIAQRKKRGYYVIEKDGVVVFCTDIASEASKFIGVTSSSLCRYIKGTRSHRIYKVKMSSLVGGGL